MGDNKKDPDWIALGNLYQHNMDTSQQFTADNLRQSLNNHYVAFTFEKKNGEIRKAIGTREPTLLESVGGQIPTGRGQESFGVINYWDMTVNGWRSCCEALVKSIDGLFDTPDEAYQFINQQQS